MADGIQLKAGLDDKVSPKLKKMSKNVKRTGDRMDDSSESTGRFGFALNNAARFGGIFSARMLGITALLGAFTVAIHRSIGRVKAFASSGILMNAVLEKIGTQFRVITGSAETARAKMKELVDFSASTPFQLADVADAAKQLESVNLGNLAQLTIVGDAAAFAAQPIAELARTFTKLKSGDFGEPFARLRELALANKQELQGEGLRFDAGGGYKGSIEDAMEAVNNIIARKFGGMMKEMSNTWDGAISTMKDNWSLLAKDVMAESFEYLKGRIVDTTAAINEMRDSDAPEVFGQKIAMALWKVDTWLSKIIYKFKNIREWSDAAANVVAAGWAAAARSMALHWDVFGVGVKFLINGIAEHMVERLAAAARATDELLADHAGSWEAFGYLISSILNHEYGNVADAFDGMMYRMEQNLINAGKVLNEPTVNSNFAQAGKTWGRIMGGELSDQLEVELATAGDKFAKALQALPEFIGPKAPVFGGTGVGGEEGVEKAGDAAAAIPAKWTKAMDKFQAGLQSGFDVLATGILDGVVMLRDITNAIFGDLVRSGIKAIGSLATEWIVKHAAMLFATKAFETGKTTVSVSGSTARASAAYLEATANIALAASATAAGAAEVMKAHSWIPFVGVAIGGAMVGAMLAILSGVGKHATGYMPGAGSGIEDDRLAWVSANEAIIPAGPARQFRPELEAIMNGEYPSGGGGSSTFNFHIHGGGDNIARQIEDEVVPILKRLNRQGRLRLGKARA